MFNPTSQGDLWSLGMVGDWSQLTVTFSPVGPVANSALLCGFESLCVYTIESAGLNHQAQADETSRAVRLKRPRD